MFRAFLLKLEILVSFAQFCMQPEVRSGANCAV